MREREGWREREAEGGRGGGRERASERVDERERGSDFCYIQCHAWQNLPCMALKVLLWVGIMERPGS